MVRRPFRQAPSSTTRAAVSTLPSSRALLWRISLRVAITSPVTTPLTSTTWERIFASISPLSPTIRVFSLVISPTNRPSMRTVSLNESFPSNSEPRSMKAVSPLPELMGERDGIEPPSSPPSPFLPRPNVSAMPGLLLAMERGSAEGAQDLSAGLRGDSRGSALDRDPGAHRRTHLKRPHQQRPCQEAPHMGPERHAFCAVAFERTRKLECEPQHKEHRRRQV